VGSSIVLLPNSATSSDEELAMLGMRLWPLTFAKTEDVERARHLFIGEMLKRGMPPQDVTTAAIAGLTSSQWAHFGYPTLVAGHKFAAALMSTKAYIDSMQDIDVPWLAFRCIVPDGILQLGDGSPIDRVMISRCVARNAPGSARFDPTAADAPNAVFWQMEAYANGRQGSRMHVYNVSLHGLLTESSEYAIEVEDAHTATLDARAHDAAKRMCVLLQRYVLGLLITVQQHPNFKGANERPVPPTVKGSRRDGPPAHRTFLLGRPIDVDCRGAVRHYLSGDRAAPPSVQTWVIGHWKRQVIGVGRSGRKVIWVQPYWRGPENAPILVRPYRIGHQGS
jgi:hypothetical protein